MLHEYESKHKEILGGVVRNHAEVPIGYYST